MFALRVSGVVQALVLIGLHGAAVAGSWQPVTAGKSESIEMDVASVIHNSSGVTAWSQIRLERKVGDAAVGYDVIRAQNSYDCKTRRFTTLRRAYLNGSTVFREEVVSRQRANTVEIGSIDERLFNLACMATTADNSPAGSKAGSGLAEKASGNVEEERPTAMHADMRMLTGAQGAPTLTPVVDTTHVAQADRPKMIVLPAIDKAAADKAASEMAAMGGKLKSSAPAVEVTGLAVPAKRNPPQPTATQTTVEPPSAESAADRRLRELHYATSGPRRKVTKRRVAKTPVVEAEKASVAKPTHWSYEGDGGPSNWAELRPDYAACGSGRRQSPIDIREGIQVNLEDIKFDYKPTQFRITDTGHTVQVDVGQGMGLTVMNKRYELLQFHFHRPSEERVNGRAFDMVVHMVHRNLDGQLAVVAIFLEKGSEHPLIQTLWNNLPLEKSMDVTPENVIDPNKLLPENRSYWTYMGSLTTPPCTENVLWMVLKQPVQVTGEQVAIFSHLYRNNTRPVQPANGRLVKGSR